MLYGYDPHPRLADDIHDAVSKPVEHEPPSSEQVRTAMLRMRSNASGRFSYGCDKVLPQAGLPFSCHAAARIISRRAAAMNGGTSPGLDTRLCDLLDPR